MNNKVNNQEPKELCIMPLCNREATKYFQDLPLCSEDYESEVEADERVTAEWNAYLVELQVKHGVSTHNLS